MLEELSIRNYALIDTISLAFRSGFNVLTGETGAGKSIIVGSLSLLMGGKAEADVIRSGKEEASVSAVISINKDNSEALEWLKSRDIACEDGAVIVRRTIKTSGRGSIFIQDTPVTRGDLESFMGLLFDLHGQHNHESLLHKENHRRFLDRFAGIETEVMEYNKTFLKLVEMRRNLDNACNSQKDRDAKLEILQYAVDEINAAALRAGEMKELENEAQRLSDFEKLAGNVNTAANALFDDEESVLSLCRRTKNAMENAAQIDASLSSLNKRFEELFFELEDIAGDFRTYSAALSYDPKRQETVDERLALLYKLRKKYGGGAAGSPEESILAYRSSAEAEIETLSTVEENRGKLKTDIAALEKELVSAAAALRQKRTAAALHLSECITAILKRLGMPNACFSASVTPKIKGEGGQSPVCGPWGAEDIEFLISANTGEPLKDLSRIASGGELSRIMLAIKSVFSTGGHISKSGSAADSVETLVFDEIDTGIGGEVALSVAEYLAKIGEYKQIFCVTHLASIAVRAGNHFKVEKHTEGGRTFTGVGPLSPEGRRREIARMLAGDNTEAALKHADNLIIKYGKESTA